MVDARACGLQRRGGRVRRACARCASPSDLRHSRGEQPGCSLPSLVIRTTLKNAGRERSVRAGGRRTKDEKKTFNSENLYARNNILADEGYHITRFDKPFSPLEKKNFSGFAATDNAWLSPLCSVLSPLLHSLG